MRTVADWVLADNLRPFLTSVGWFAGYAFDEDDWLAISYGLEGTDQEADHWFDYEFANKYPVSIRLAIDPGTSVIHVRIKCADAIGPKAEAALVIFQHFRGLTNDR